MVIYPADIIQEIKRAAALGVKASIADIDFSEIMDRTRKSVIADRRHMEENVKQVEGLTFYNKTAKFIGDYTARVGDEDIQAKNIFIVSGARPDIPEIKGLEDVSYLTSRNVLDLTKAPKSMIIVGGGYIAAEMAHFFSSVGVEVIILSRSPRLVKSTDPEVSGILTQALRTRMCVKTGVEVTEVRDSKGRKEVTTKSNKGDIEIFNSESLFIATGLKSNAEGL